MEACARSKKEEDMGRASVFEERRRAEEKSGGENIEVKRTLKDGRNIVWFTEKYFKIFLLFKD